MPKASELKAGMIVEINGNQYVTKSVDVRSPSARGAATLYKTIFNDLKTKQKFEQTFKGDDQITDVDAAHVKLSYLYFDGQFYTFMNVEDYSQYQLAEQELTDLAPWLEDGMEGITGILVGDDQLATIKLPSTVEKEVLETTPSLKGATATKSAKPAIISGGITVNVPDYIETGERIKVSPEDKRFISRV